MLKVINLFGPPGVGKSTVRSGLFWRMRSAQMSVEEVSEYAKYLVLTGRLWQLQVDQLYLLAKQNHKQIILENKYDYAVTDSPLPLCAFYAPGNYLAGFDDLVMAAFERYENLNIYLSRKMDESDFELTGRVHDLQASKEIDLRMREFLQRRGISIHEMEVDAHSPERIHQLILQRDRELLAAA
jgi:hypothetical protein